MGTARGNKVPDGASRNQYDGYRLRLERDGNRVRLITRGGYNWADNHPWIVEAARRNRHKQFIIDGEAVLLAFHGISDFDGLHSRQHDDKAQLYAVDILAMGGDDLRQLPSSISRDCLRARSGCSSVAFAMGLSAQ